MPRHYTPSEFSKLFTAFSKFNTPGVEKLCVSFWGRSRQMGVLSNYSTCLTKFCNLTHLDYIYPRIQKT